MFKKISDFFTFEEFNKLYDLGEKGIKGYIHPLLAPMFAIMNYTSYKKAINEIMKGEDSWMAHSLLILTTFYFFMTSYVGVWQIIQKIKAKWGKTNP